MTLAELLERQRVDGRRASYGIPSEMCLRCGMTGPHKSADECISALRDRLASQPEQTERQASPRRRQEIKRFLAG